MTKNGYAALALVAFAGCVVFGLMGSAAVDRSDMGSALTFVLAAGCLLMSGSIWAQRAMRR